MAQAKVGLFEGLNGVPGVFFPFGLSQASSRKTSEDMERIRPA